MLYTRAAVLFGIEATPGTAVAVAAGSDALLVNEPNYTTNFEKIERKFARSSLSDFPYLNGRKLGQITFKHEIRSNGKATGLTADAPMLARLLRACGYKLSPMSAVADRVYTVIADAANTGISAPSAAGGNATWAAGGTPVNTDPCMFTLTCTTGGNAAAAKFTVAGNNPNVSPTTQTGVASSAAIPLGTSGATVLPTIVSGTFAVGDVFRVLVLPQGLKLLPITTGFETATIEAYYDGLKHKLTGAVGTFTFSCDAGGTVTADFTFMGVHTPVVNQSFPTGLIFEATMPQLFQSALLTWGDNAGLAIQSMSFDAKVTPAVRSDANQANGMRGYIVGDRDPTGGFNTEAVTEDVNAFWNNYENAVQKTFFARVGAVTGNMICVFGPRVQTDSLGYQNKDNLRSYQVGMAFCGYQDDDEVAFFLC